MRKDERYTWSKDDDLMLVEMVLRHVRNGGAAIDGCREFAEYTGDERSVDAVKFRFHTQLKQHHEKAYELAKAEGKKIKAEKRRYTTQGERLETILEKHVGKEDEEEISIEDVYILLKRYMKQEPKVSQEDVDHIKKINHKLFEQNKELVESNKKLVQAFNEIEADYKALKGALDVLKKAGLSLDVPKPTSSRKYTVDGNGLVIAVE